MSNQDSVVFYNIFNSLFNFRFFLCPGIELAYNFAERIKHPVPFCHTRTATQR